MALPEDRWPCPTSASPLAAGPVATVPSIRYREHARSRREERVFEAGQARHRPVHWTNLALTARGPIISSIVTQNQIVTTGICSLWPNTERATDRSSNC